MASIENLDQIVKHYEDKRAFTSEELLSGLSFNTECRKIADRTQKTGTSVGNIELLTKDTSSDSLLKNLHLNDECITKANKVKEICTKVHIDLTQKDKSQKQLAPKTLNLNNYSESRVTPRVISSIVDMLCEQFSFLYIEGMALYVYTEGKLKKEKLEKKIPYSKLKDTTILPRKFWEKMCLFMILFVLQTIHQ